ncbi:MAG: NADH-quinone oxidoreductase subunit L [Planctomycetaceae bacterium]|nr:NADH-quinone oxidoreductase subunit L [Planctomycetaceae bacterium]
MSSNLIALQNKFLGHGQTVYDELSRLHEQQGHISDGDIEALARQFSLPAQHVRSTAKFYDELSHDTPARHVVRVCNGEACRAAGCDELIDQMQQKLGCSLGDTNGDRVRLEHVTCVGYCGCGPNALVDDLPVTLADDAAVDQVIEHVTDGAALALEEPANAVYRPTADGPCVLMRHFDKDVVSVDAARAAGIYSALERAVTTMTPDQVVEQITASQLRGRGGAGFPTGIKFQTVRDNEPDDGSGRRFIVVNADEGDAGAYIDKELFERDPHTQLEGILIAAYACGARETVVYNRFEYPRALRIMRQAVEEAKAEGLIGQPLFGTDFQCDVRVVKGQGAYICGEETSLLRSLEGVPALVGTRPPFPAQKGLWGCPTAVNNVETIHNLSWIIANGGAAYAAIGHEKSRGTKAVSLNTRVKRPGMYEVPLGTTLRELIFDIAGGMADGQTLKAVQVGGPLGGILPESMLDTRLDFESLAAAGGILGHAGIVVYSQDDDLMRIARGLMHFCAVESCGKCFPCRIGSVRGTELMDQMIDTGATEERMNLLTELCETMKFGSLCALGGMIPMPIESLMTYFPEEIDRYRRESGTTAVPA